MTTVHLFDAVRTPRAKGKPDGALAGVTPYELVAQLAAALRRRHGDAALAAVERVTLGCVTQVGAQGGHVALMARSYAGLPDTAVATTLNNYCVSGMSAAALAARAIAAGDEGLALAGGVESMSQAPFEGDRASFFSDPALATRLRYVSPPIVGDLLATLEGLTRDELDAVTVDSHQRAGLAWAEGRYASTVVPVTRADGSVVDRDEMVRPKMTAADIARFGPAFAALGALGHDALLTAAIPGLTEVAHLHAVPHCPPIADGAALLLLGSPQRGAELGLRSRARIAATLELNTDPLKPFAAGFEVMDRILARAGLAARDLGAIEFMEAFAAVPATFRRRALADDSRVNASGGHLAMGHPMGASGAILVATLLAEMERRDVEWGLAVAHAVSGVGAAVLLQRAGG
jgi:acetyl-CoA acetyltransferase family protein